MNIEILMQYVTYALMAVGVLAFMVSVITQVIKEMPGLKNIQTNAVALVVALILCPLAVIILCIYLQMAVLWYYIVGAVIAAFIVYLVATGGWERVSEMWNRTKYSDEKITKWKGLDYEKIIYQPADERQNRRRDTERA